MSKWFECEEVETKTDNLCVYACLFPTEDDLLPLNVNESTPATELISL